MNIIWGNEDFVDIFWGRGGITNLDYILCILGQGTEWGIFFGVAKFSNIFLGVLEVPDIFWG